MNYQYTDQKRWEELQRRLKTSPFRSRFKLGERELAYLAEKGGRTIGKQAEKFIVERLSPAAPGTTGNRLPCADILSSSLNTPPLSAAVPARKNGMAFPADAR